MIISSTPNDFSEIYEIINDAAVAYKGLIPEDRWHEPYMAEAELQDQIDDGVTFWCYWEDGVIIGVMGIQDNGDVTLIRHAYIPFSLNWHGNLLFFQIILYEQQDRHCHRRQRRDRGSHRYPARQGLFRDCPCRPEGERVRRHG
jgi:hypothetical protein